MVGSKQGAVLWPVVLAAVVGGCKTPDPPADDARSASADLASEGEVTPPSSAPGADARDEEAEADEDANPAARQAAEVPVGVPCGALACMRYPDAKSALLAVLARQPEVLAFGEAHALKGTEGVPSATIRFERQLLPVLAERGATELVVELLNPATGCRQAVETVRKEQKQVTEKQASTNQNRFISLGHAARKLAVVPYILEPSCDEYEVVAKGGPDGITRMLELIAEKTEEKVSGFWTRNQRMLEHPSQPAPRAAETASPNPAVGKGADPSKPAKPQRVFTPAQRQTPLVLAYGGALHNDIDVPEHKQTFTYGTNLVQRTSGKYIALDLIVPEYIKPTEVWKSLPWYEHFDATKAPAETTLFQVDEYSYVLIFGRTQTPEPTAAPPNESPPPRQTPAQ